VADAGLAAERQQSTSEQSQPQVRNGTGLVFNRNGLDCPPARTQSLRAAATAWPVLESVLSSRAVRTDFEGRTDPTAYQIGKGRVSVECVRERVSGRAELSSGDLWSGDRVSGQGSSDCGLRTYERCVGEAERRLSDCVSASDLDFGQYREGAEPASNGSNGFLPVAYHLPANSSLSHLRVEPVYPALSCSLAVVLVDNHRPPLAEVMAVRSSSDEVEQGAGVPLSPRGELWHLGNRSRPCRVGLPRGNTAAEAGVSQSVASQRGSPPSGRVAASGVEERHSVVFGASASESTRARAGRRDQSVGVASFVESESVPWHLGAVAALSGDGKTDTSASKAVSASSQSSDISTESLLASRVAAEVGARELSEPLVSASLSEKTGISAESPSARVSASQHNGGISIGVTPVSASPSEPELRSTAQLEDQSGTAYDLLSPTPS
jgi:hypothetical protein